MFFMTNDVDSLVATTVQDCLQGTKVTGSKEDSWEVLNYQTGMADSRARIMTSQHRPLNIVVALARFTWLIAGNNRLEDIAFYEPKVRGFSDDGLTVPGSDYGLRLMQPRPGLNQLEGVIKRLKDDPTSRQATAVIWQPEDAVRESRDIPCTHGMFFHVRQSARSESLGEPGQLVMTVTMRSNNAFRILPFNVFEFTMLQEIVAAELGIEPGPYTHWASSMHVYENQREWNVTQDLAYTVSDDTVPVSLMMPPMPQSGHGALWEAQTMALYEAQLRHAYYANDFVRLFNEAQDNLSEYWFGLLAVLAGYISAKHGWDSSYGSMPEYLRDSAAAVIQKA